MLSDTQICLIPGTPVKDSGMPRKIQPIAETIERSAYAEYEDTGDTSVVQNPGHEITIMLELVVRSGYGAV